MPSLGYWTSNRRQNYWGSRTIRFRDNTFRDGALDVERRGPPRSLLGAAEASTGLSVVLPSTLPNGISAPNGYFVIPTLTATIVLGPSAGHGLSGSSLVATLGPGIGVTYAGTSGLGNIYPLGILTVARPLATSTGATTSELERFLLSQPGIPPDLAQELHCWET